MTPADPETEPTRNPVKRALARGSTSIGTLVMEFASTGIARIAATAGADFVLYDMEHTGWGLERIRTLLAATRGESVVPFVRVPTLDRHFVSGVLDLGALGVMLPAVEDAEQARTLVEAGKFPPSGQRRFGLIYRDLVADGLVAAMRRADEDTLIICQIETRSGVDNVDDIAAVDGVDVLWLGPYDLSISLGLVEDLSHERYVDAVKRTLQACERHGKTAGVLVETVEEASSAIADGFRCLMYSFDAALYAHALEEGIGATRRVAER